MHRTPFVLAALAALIFPAVPLAGPPPSFVNSAVVTGLDVPTAFAYAPDGRIFVSEKSGVVKVVDGGLTSVFLDARDETNEYGDRGVLGVAVDPAFGTNGYIYVFHIVEPAPLQPDSDAPATGEVFRIRQSAADPNVADPATRQTLLTGFDNHHYSHSGGCLRFDAEGRLLVSFGDGSSYNEVDALALNAYDLDSLNGKIVRVDRASGDGVAENPYYEAGEPGAVHSKVLARGFRNPFRFGIDPDSGDLYVGDVGWNDWEEVNRVPLVWSDPDRELNFGWPCYEGGQGAPYHQGGFANDPATAATCLGVYPPSEGGIGLGAVPALYAYDHSGAGAELGTSVTGGVFYQGASYPVPYAGRYFFADYSRDRFQTLTPEGVVEDFGAAGGWGNPVDVQLATNGNVAYLGVGDGTLHEIVYVGGNRPPVVVATATPTDGPARSRVILSAVGSTDPDGDKLNYRWDFGDGKRPVKRKQVRHLYRYPGTYYATVTVSDRRRKGAVLSASKTVQVNIANTVPTVSFVAPLAGAQYAIGDVLPVQIDANDAENGALDGEAVSWRVVQHHLGHLHYLSLNHGATGSVIVPDHGDDSFLELRTSAVDAYGATAETSITLVPLKVSVTIDGVPAGVQIIVDGQTRTTPYTWQSIVNGAHAVIAPTPQNVGGTDYTFDSWSDGFAASHAFITQATPLTLTATYVP